MGECSEARCAHNNRWRLQECQTAVGCDVMVCVEVVITGGGCAAVAAVVAVHAVGSLGTPRGS